MKYKKQICVSIGDPDVEKVLALLERVNMAEIRIDLGKYTKNSISRIFEAHSNLIATCREGYFNNSQRAELLKYAIDCGAAWVDVESDSDRIWASEMINFVKDSNSRLIVSRHWFENTPPIEELINEIDSMCQMGANIVKIATMVNSPKESAQLLGLYARYNNLVAIGMGSCGVITRVSSLFLGAPFTFASIESGSSTAPGQLNLEEMISLTEKIGSAGK